MFLGETGGEEFKSLKMDPENHGFGSSRKPFARRSLSGFRFVFGGVSIKFPDARLLEAVENTHRATQMDLKPSGPLHVDCC